jgi:DNA excision repair protein ERCC-1
LQSIKNVGLEIGDIAADYQVGTHNGVLFLRYGPGKICPSMLMVSLKYHRLHPEYIHQRIEKMRNMYRVRILLVLCDVVSVPAGDRRAGSFQSLSAERASSVPARDLQDRHHKQPDSLRRLVVS